MTFGPLISPQSLAEFTKPICLLDTRPGPKAYSSGHLAGPLGVAFHADLNIYLSSASDPNFEPSQGGRHPLPAPSNWAGQLGNWGIAPDTYVVAYDNAIGGNGACRLWWMLRAVGHTRIAVLNGGIEEMLRIGHSAGWNLTSEEPICQPVQPPYPSLGWRLPTDDIECVERRLRDPRWKVLDVRSKERWRGEEEPIDPVKGRIPGSVNLPYAENLGADGCYKSPEALRRMYLELLGGTSPENLIVHCGSGVTACHTLLALELAGLHGASLYVGSYSEWCRRGKPLGSGPSN